MNTETTPAPKEVPQPASGRDELRALWLEWLDGAYDGPDLLRRVKLAVHGPLRKPCARCDGTGEIYSYATTPGGNRIREVDACPMCAASGAPQEAQRPDILERLTYHALERDDLTLNECLDYLRDGWKSVAGRTERQMVLQLLSLLAGAPQEAPGDAPSDKLDAARYRWLRDTPWTDPHLVNVIQLQRNSKWDAAIDAAMKGPQ